MKLKTITDECFQDYKKASMYLFTCFCDWKCCREGNFDTSFCQNSRYASDETIEISNEDLFKRYVDNPLTEAIVVGGFEPFLQFGELVSLISHFRYNNCFDDFVIYTGYTEDELVLLIEMFNVLLL